MKFELSPGLQLAFERAHHSAAQANAAEVEPRHLLFGLLAEEEGKGVALAAQAGADVALLRAHLGLPATFSETVVELPLAGALQGVMAYARELTSLHGDEGTISTDQVFLALVTKDDSLASELAQFGFDRDRLHADIVGASAPLVLEEELDLHEPAEQFDTARILDASANRAREALRVLEDHARFALNDAFLCSQWKLLRHDLGTALAFLPADLLLAARETLADVGTSISTEQEWQRASLDAVVKANARRLQEALRSLEEYGKIASADFAQRVEQIRYRSYTVERSVVHGGKARERLAGVQLYVLVTDSLCKVSLVGTVREAVLGGAQIIQLREKDVDDRTFLKRARDVRSVTRSAGALFIVNDRPDLARLADADGVHLGQDDLPVADARRILGPDAIIGVSTHNHEQMRQAILEGATYIALGPTFPSSTKQFEAFPGLEFIEQAMVETSIPAFAIGGIHLENAARVRAVGATRIAVSSAICAADDPRIAAQQLRDALAVRA